jgi:hypothetical protein
VADTSKVKVSVDFAGPIWFIGWLFTLAYAELSVLQALFGIIIWPWYLGVAVR